MKWRWKLLWLKIKIQWVRFRMFLRYGRYKTGYLSGRDENDPCLSWKCRFNHDDGLFTKDMLKSWERDQ